MAFRYRPVCDVVTGLHANFSCLGNEISLLLQDEKPALHCYVCEFYACWGI